MDQKRHRKKQRERRCLVTGETYPAHKMIRFVLGPAGNIIPDVAGKLPGRGGWILADRAVLQSAMKKKIFVRFGHRAFASKRGLAGRQRADVETLEEPEDKAATGQKMQVRVDDNLPDLVEQLLRQRCLNYLGLVNRAGLLV